MNGAPLAPAERQRLAKVCGLLGSDHDGERASAAVAATAIIRNAGLTWAQIIPGGAPDEAEPVDDIDAALEFLLGIEIAGQWPQHFLASIARLRRAGHPLRALHRENGPEITATPRWKPNEE